MARRYDHSKEELLTMATDAGHEMININGFNDFSARKLAKEIGYTVGTIYNNFGSHDLLIAHINGKTLDIMMDHVVTRQKKGEIGANAIKTLASAYLDFATKHYNIWRLMFDYTMDKDTQLPDWYMEKIRVLFQLVETAVQPLCKDATHTTNCSKAIWAGVHGVCDLGLSGKLDVVGASSIQTLMDNLIDHYIAGIKTDSS